jgi:cytoskeletal protein CcmA (bactofilin family)
MTTILPTSENAAEKMTTVIAEDLHIKGTLTFETSLMIKGTLEGEIISKGLIVVGSTAKINAEIVTKSLVSHGEIQGDVTASEQVMLMGTAHHTGKVTTPNIVVESGSVFNGSCVMVREKVEAPKEEQAPVEGDSPEVSLVQESPDERLQIQTSEASTLPAETTVEQEPSAPSEPDSGQFDSSSRGDKNWWKPGAWPINGK